MFENFYYRLIEIFYYCVKQSAQKRLHFLSASFTVIRMCDLFSFRSMISLAVRNSLHAAYKQTYTISFHSQKQTSRMAWSENNAVIIYHRFNTQKFAHVTTFLSFSASDRDIYNAGFIATVSVLNRGSLFVVLYYCYRKQRTYNGTGIRYLIDCMSPWYWVIVFNR